MFTGFQHACVIQLAPIPGVGQGTNAEVAAGLCAGLFAGASGAGSVQARWWVCTCEQVDGIVDGCIYILHRREYIFKGIYTSCWLISSRYGLYEVL